jgi:heparan-alpha-glucosaminide N-acetyltransferase
MTKLDEVRDWREEARDARELAESSLAAPAADGRVASVDALRGLTILLMVFVNDLGPPAPAWMHHIQPPNADGMTLADVVFPSFLFIVGMSILLAFERASEAAKSRWAPWRHVLVRTAGLLVMGVIELNHEEDRTLGGQPWGLLAFAAMILAWCVVPRGRGGKRAVLIGLKALGIVGLLALLAIYRREPGPADVPFLGRVEGWAWLRSGWWGILGLIGWAYLTVSLLTLLLGRRREWLMGALALLMVLHLASRRGGLFTRLGDKPWLGPAKGAFDALARAIEGLNHYVGLGDATGSLAAVAMAGCLLGTILRRDSDVAPHRDRLSWAAMFLLGLLVAGGFADTFEGINKIAATPTWCLWSAALAGSAWVLLYLVMDVARLRAWSFFIRPAGDNPLLAYFLHPIVIWLAALSGLEQAVLGYKDASDPWEVVGGSLGMSLFVCAAAGLLARLGLRMRL